MKEVRYTMCNETVCFGVEIRLTFLRN